MICKKCGENITNEQTLFCPVCGEPLFENGAPKQAVPDAQAAVQKQPVRNVYSGIGSHLNKLYILTGIMAIAMVIVFIVSGMIPFFGAMEVEAFDKISEKISGSLFLWPLFAGVVIVVRLLYFTEITLLQKYEGMFICAGVVMFARLAISMGNSSGVASSFASLFAVATLILIGEKLYCESMINLTAVQSFEVSERWRKLWNFVLAIMLALIVVGIITLLFAQNTVKDLNYKDYEEYLDAVKKREIFLRGLVAAAGAADVALATLEFRCVGATKQLFGKD